MGLSPQIQVNGTVAILEKAAQRGLTDFGAALERLEQTNFRLSPKLRENSTDGLEEALRRWFIPAFGS
jgi:predicted nucleic acid-binding protein